jgi:hypothetical protein
MKAVIGLEKTTLGEVQKVQELLHCGTLDETLMILCQMIKILHYSYVAETRNNVGSGSGRESEKREVNGYAK